MAAANFSSMTPRHEEKAIINMPGFGDPHGVSFIYYDEDDKARVVNDQHGFHNGVNPRAGKPLVY